MFLALGVFSSSAFFFKLGSEKSSEEINGESPEPEVFQRWKAVSFFKNQNPSLYEFKKNPNLIISVQKESLIFNPFKRKGPKGFFNETEKIKDMIFSSSSLRDRKVSIEKIESSGRQYLFYTRGSYKDFQKKLVFFEDWNFYSGNRSLSILVHNMSSYTQNELENVIDFVFYIIDSDSSLRIQDKKQFSEMVKKIIE